MVRASTCALNGREIGIDEALRLREQTRRSGRSSLDFRCVEGDEMVRARKEGGKAGAHFELEPQSRQSVERSRSIVVGVGGGQRRCCHRVERSRQASSN